VKRLVVGVGIVAVVAAIWCVLSWRRSQQLERFVSTSDYTESACGWLWPPTRRSASRSSRCSRTIGLISDEVDVEPSHGGRGLGTALVRTACEWATASGFSILTLTTFRAVPWIARPEVNGLPHALEVARSPDVVNAATLAAAYERLGFTRNRGSDRADFDSVAAIDAGITIWRELAERDAGSDYRM